MARSRGSGGIRYRLQYWHMVRTRISIIITIGPSLTGLRGTQLAGSISYTLVTDPISFILLLPFTFTCTVYFLAYYYCFPLDTLIPLFTANRWDWQPHRKLGANYLFVLCAGFMLLLVQSKALDEAPYKLSEAVAKLAGITFWSLPFSYWFDKSWFLTEGRLATVLIIPSSWGSQLGGYLPASHHNINIQPLNITQHSSTTNILTSPMSSRTKQTTHKTSYGSWSEMK
jgi:hypothetical protein